MKEKLEKAEAKKPSPAFGKNTELEKVKKDLKTKTEEAEKLAKDCEDVKEALRRLKEDAADDILAVYKARTPKKPTDMNTKLQMKKMVEELESEIGKFMHQLTLTLGIFLKQA